MSTAPRNPSSQAAARPTTAARPIAAAHGLPAFTASGLDPKVLASYPAALRSVLAGVPTIEQAYDIARRYAGMTDEQIMQALPQDMSIPGHLAYACRPAGYVEAQPADHLKNGWDDYTATPAGPPATDDTSWFPGQ